MKLSKLLFTVFLVTTFMSCSNDDDDSNNGGDQLTNENIVGTFELVSLTGSVETTGTVDGVNVSAVTNLEGRNFMNARFVFGEDGLLNQSGSLTIDYETYAGGQLIHEESEVINLNEDGEDLPYMVSSNGNTLTVDGDPANVDYFDGTELRLRFIESDVEEGIQYEGYTLMVLRKL